ncbi:MAG: alginate lyase family protein, partial [Chitinophagaceae bacterium]
LLVIVIFKLVNNDAVINKTGLVFYFDKQVNENDFTIFGQPFSLTEPIDFHKDISSGKSFPLHFSKTIDMRTDKFGSAKTVWEVNRLEFLLPLLINYTISGDKSKLDLFVKIMSDWDEQNPYMKGLNWYSNIEVNIRLINWYWCWLLLESDPIWQTEEKYAEFRANTWLPLIYKHCHYSAKNPSFFSSANNHLIAEYTGLFLASTLWQFKESSKWMKKSKAGLEREIILQHSKKGINREEASAYIQFITDFFLVSYVAAQHHGIPFSKQYEEKLIDICGYINNFLDSKGQTPRYGDDDDGRMILPDANMQTNNFLSILNSSAVLFNKPALKRANANWDVKSQLLTAHINGKEQWEKLPADTKEAGSVFYKEEGHFIIRKKTDDKEIYCHFDAAPLGYLSIAAHGHADALSFLLYADGCPFLVDPGTFAYHTHSDWRKYFTSTLAHNTITIDKTDQALLAGPTLWLNHYRCKVLEASITPEKDTIVASHDGYSSKGIVHTRSLEFDRVSDTFTLTDMIEGGEGNHLLNMPFHLHPAVTATKKSDNTWLLTHSATATTIEISFENDVTVNLVKASDTEKMGWYSESFMKKEKSSTLLGERPYTEKLVNLQTTIKIINSY